MFYDHAVEPAAYIAPMGKIAGELTRKRQFKIKNGVMEYALESSVNIQDNILQQELSHTSDEKMKSILATIQKEQNQIIRNEKAGTLIIQGVAGSGKTSIALHRIAFLLYRSKDRLSAKNVTVIDEMQDYTPIQYAALNLLFKCQKTILGDFGQFLNPNHLHTLEDLKKLYSEAGYAELSKSYRSTYEIISFAKKVKSAGTIEAIERHGEPPAIIGCRDHRDELAYIKNCIDAFAKKAYSSLGIIMKTNEDAKRLYDFLSADNDVHLISPDSTRFANGISITSIQMSKGLEFDEVIIPYVNSDQYSTEYDRNLLYIACTRAMHRLTLLYTGEVSSLIGSILTT